MPLRAQDVFVPGSFPAHTYIERESQELEKHLRDAIDTPGQVVSLSGPSKCGKTVLVEKVVGRDGLLPISGAGIREPEEIWERALDWMGVPHANTGTRKSATTVGGSAQATGGGSLLSLAKAEVSATAKFEKTSDTSSGHHYNRRGLTEVVETLANSEYVVLLDDFHYMPREVQAEASKSIKEAVRQGVKIVTAEVRHRGDDVVRALPELRGRVKAVDMTYWTNDELSKIGTHGFSVLKAGIPERLIERFVGESAGSPQLMQLICLQACFVLGIRIANETMRTYDPDESQIRAIFEQTSSGADFRSLVDVLDAGPKTRGTERKTYLFHDGTEGDVYRCVLKCIASDPPRLSFTYEELLKRAGQNCLRAAPVGSSVAGTCVHMHKLALDKFPAERVIDWDDAKQILDIPDPYLVFYLRWSNRMHESQA